MASDWAHDDEGGEYSTILMRLLTSPDLDKVTFCLGHLSCVLLQVQSTPALHNV